MRIVIGSDHAGFPLKEGLTAYIRQLGHQVVDVGTHGPEPVDYPDYAEALSKTLLGGQAERGVLICGSGVGASVAANKVPGIRAGLCHDGRQALKRLGKKRWRRHVADVVERFKVALEADYIVIGGGNAKKVGELPPGARLGANANAFVGGFRLWEET
jgi:RpiB/LacA/LacB family sugar-phosphate isomerase